MYFSFNVDFFSNMGFSLIYQMETATGVLLGYKWYHAVRIKAIYLHVTARSSRSVAETEQGTEPQPYSFFFFFGRRLGWGTNSYSAWCCKRNLKIMAPLIFLKLDISQAPLPFLTFQGTLLTQPWGVRTTVGKHSWDMQGLKDWHHHFLATWP